MINLKRQPDSSLFFRIMTYNIGYGGGLDSLGKTRLCRAQVIKNLEAISENIQKANPDILSVQEIDLDSRRSCFINQIKFLSRACQFPFVVFSKTWDFPWVPYPPTFKVKNHFGKVCAGQAIFSKFPILAHESIVFPKPDSNSFIYNYFYLDRVAQFATLQLPSNQPLTLCNLHLEAWDKQARRYQAKQILHHPTDIIMGDFNALHPLAEKKKGFPDDPGYTYEQDPTLTYFLENPALSECLSSLQEDPINHTFPSDSPTRRLDYMFYDHNNLQLIQSRVVNQAKGSDHLPLVSDFIWQKP